MRVAVVGSGVAGLASAHRLGADHDVTVFEASERLGGHVRTVDVDLGDGRRRVDVGFVVFNETNYPRFVRLLSELGVGTQESEMSFAVSVSPRGLEYGGTGLAGIFAQPSNVVRPSFHRLLRDVARFNRVATSVATGPPDDRTVEEFLATEGLGAGFVNHFLLPLGSAVWSVEPARFAVTPIQSLATFLHRHDFLRVRGRPTWRTVVGGASSYVEALVAARRWRACTATPVVRVERRSEGVRVVLADGQAEFDRVVMAVPSDQALAVLDVPTRVEQEVLGAFRWTPNTVTLHTDARMMPRRRRAWASWNYVVSQEPTALPTVTYLMNRLQRLETSVPILVTLNRQHDIDPTSVVGQWSMRHPVIDAAALAAQRRLGEINASGPVHFCGAYWGSGFHEDGMASAELACDALTWASEAAR